MEKVQNITENSAKYGFLNANVLKIVALVAMTIDHIGVIFCPEIEVLRLIGRLAFPIFAFFIAEGCRYTRNKWRYFGLIFVLGLLFEVFARLVGHTEDCNIFITFSLSILLVYLLMWAKKEIKENNKKMATISCISFFVAVAAVYVLTMVLPQYTAGLTRVDYGFWGVMVPVFVALFDWHYAKVIMFAFALVLMCTLRNPIWLDQWFCLMTVPLVMWYNGERGKYRLKYLFYIYYPAHLMLLYGILALVNLNM